MQRLTRKDVLKNALIVSFHVKESGDGVRRHIFVLKLFSFEIDTYVHSHIIPYYLLQIKRNN